MPSGQLRGEEWGKLTQDYPDPDVITAILDICTFDARIGYEGYRNTTTIHLNLKTAIADAQTVAADIFLELNESCLEVFPHNNGFPSHLSTSPLFLTDMSDGSKTRIHLLTYKPGDMSRINAGIPDHYSTIEYSRIEDAIQVVQRFGRNSIVIKRDLASSFHHITVSPMDTQLLVLQLEDTWYAERFLPFGLHTARHPLNLFAEVSHRILEPELKTANISGTIIHHLEDFVLVLDLGAIANLKKSSEIFTTLCTPAGSSNRRSKNTEGTGVSIAGLVRDSGNMVIRLRDKNL